VNSHGKYEIKLPKDITLNINDKISILLEDDSIRQLSASMLSASIYRASEKWCHGFSDVPAETYIQSVTPYIISGLVSRK